MDADGSAAATAAADEQHQEQQCERQRADARPPAAPEPSAGVEVGASAASASGQGAERGLGAKAVQGVAAGEGAAAGQGSNGGEAAETAEGREAGEGAAAGQGSDEGEATATGSGAGAVQAPGGGQAPTSKRAMKRLAKQQRIEEYKAERREQEREQKKQRREQRKEELTQAMQTLTEEEREALRKQHQETRQERTSESQQRKQRLQQSLSDGPDLVIDCDFDGMMNDGELKHLCQQLSYSYSANGKVAKPCHLHLTGFKGSVKAMCEKQITGLPNWFITKTEQSYLEHFADRKHQLVYLTADSPHEVSELEPGHIYIIGGIVDHNRYKGLCLKRAEEGGIATARLPIKKYVELDSRAVLTVNHVAQIMVEMYNRKDWKSVLDEVIPPRKRADFKKEKSQEPATPVQGKGAAAGADAVQAQANGEEAEAAAGELATVQG